MRSLGRLKSPHEFAFDILLRKQRVYIYNSVAAILVGLAALKSQSYKGSVGCSLNGECTLLCHAHHSICSTKKGILICPNNDMDGYISLSFNNRLV